jgi:hypothetical protein
VAADGSIVWPAVRRPVSTTIHVKLSVSAQEFLARTLDLMVAIREADPALVADEILEAAAALTALVEEHQGEL